MPLPLCVTLLEVFTEVCCEAEMLDEYDVTGVVENMEVGMFICCPVEYPVNE
jgi:hypothetical protein